MNRTVADSLTTLWDFSRPHTIIGSTLAVATFYLVAAHDAGFHDIPLFLLSYGSALSVNLYIVGLNQLTDIEIDRINKPQLPIPSGRLSPRLAGRIVSVAGVLALGLAAAAGPWLLGTIGTVFIVGSAYSLPPIRLKRFPVAAALSIVLSRGVVGNLGLWLNFRVGLSGSPSIPSHLFVFVGFMIGFMTVISLLKDVPDIEGDRIYEIRTFSVRFGPERVLRLCVSILSAFYVGMVGLAVFRAPGLHGATTVATHLVLLALLLRSAHRCNPRNKASMSSFYMSIWNLYYLEFGAYLIACMRA